MDRIWWGVDGGFEDATAEVGFGDPTPHVGMAAGDLVGDGWLDVVVAREGEPPRVWMNRCGSGAWLEVDLDGPASNREGYGAQVVVEAGGVRRTRGIFSLRAQGQGPARAHFGLGEVDQVDRLEVRWPDGVVTSLSGFQPNRRVVAYHPDSPRTVGGGTTGPVLVPVDGLVFSADGAVPLAGVEVADRVSGAVAVSGEDGGWSLDLPDRAEADLEVDLEGYEVLVNAIDTTVQRSPSQGVVHPLMRAGSLDGMYGQFIGLEHDPERATVQVQPVDASGAPQLGVKVALDADHDGVYAASESGAVASDELVDGTFFLVFANVRGDRARLTVTPPEGVTCDAREDLPLVPGGTTLVWVACSD